MFARIVVWLFCIDQLAALKEFKRAFQAGDAMLGGLTVLHYKDSNDKCGLGFFPVGLGHAEAMIFTIEQINNDPSLLPNVTLGFDIRDYCETVSVAVKETYEFVRDADLYHMYTNRNFSMDNETALCYSRDAVAPVSTILGPYDSASAVQISSLLSMAKIPIISFAATSDELSSNQYPYFLRTVPPDRQQARVQADLFEYFKWMYIGTVALDDSYGRFGVSALQKEAYNRGTFCLAFSEFIPRLRAATDMWQIVSRIKQQSSVKVIVVWVFGGYAKLFFEEVHRQKLGRRTWILGDGTSTEDSGLLGPLFRLLDGAIGVQPRDRKGETFLNHLYSLTPNKTRLGRNPWWDEYWKKFRSCTLDADSAADPRCSNVPLSHNEVSKLFDPYLGYLIDAIFAVAFALDKQFRCRASDREPPGKACSDRKDLLSHLKNVSFPGLTGVVEFDREGDPKNSFFEIVNIQINSKGIAKKALVGFWNSVKKPRLSLNDSAIKWANATFATTVQSSFCSQVCPPGTRQEVTTSCCWKCVTCPGGTVSKSPGSTNCTECPRKTKAER